MTDEVTSVATDNPQTTPETASQDSAGVQTPSDDGVTTPPAKEDPVNDSLDFEDLLKVPSVEERGGKSRREWKRKQEIEQPKEVELEIDEELEARMLANLESKIVAKYGDLDVLKEKAAQIERSNLETQFNSILEDKGIKPSEFNDSYKKGYSEKRDELLAAGLPQDVAVKYALEVVTAGYQADTKIQEIEGKADGRKRARVAPMSTVSSESNVVSRSQVNDLVRKSAQGDRKAQMEYNRLMDRVESGDIKIS